MVTPPIMRMSVREGRCWTKTLKTLKICVANSRVGEITMAPTCEAVRGCCLRRSISTTGMTKDRVLPDPVTAYEYNAEEAEGCGTGE